MKKLLIILSVILMMLITACSSTKNASNSSDDSDNYKIGGLFTLSGSAAAVGVAEKQGVELAVDQINSQGGLDIHGKKVKVKLVSYDVGEEPSKAVDYTQRLINNDKVNLIVGARENTQLAGELKITDPKKVLVYSAVASTPLLSVGSKYGFNVNSNGAVVKHALVQILGESPESLEKNGFDVESIKKVKRVALFGRNELYVKHGIAGAKEEVEKQGKEWAGAVVFPPGTTDFLPYITKLKELKPDVVIIDTYSYELMIPPLKEMIQTKGLDFTKGEVLLIGNDVLASDDFIAAASKEGINLSGAIGWSATPINPSPELIDFKERAQKKYGDKLGYFNGVTSPFEATMMMFKGIEESGTLTDTDSMVKAIKKTRYEGFRYPMSLDKNKQLIQPIIMMRIDNNNKLVQTDIIYRDSLYYGQAFKEVKE